jgi:retron-type reverse transcriptase
VVAAAFEKVKSKKGAAGVDGVTVEQFAQDYKNNLYKLWSASSRMGGEAVISRS